MVASTIFQTTTTRITITTTTTGKTIGKIIGKILHLAVIQVSTKTKIPCILTSTISITPTTVHTTDTTTDITILTYFTVIDLVTITTNSTTFNRSFSTTMVRGLMVTATYITDRMAKVANATYLGGCCFSETFDV